MATKEELQERVDELRLELERTREEAEAEVGALREELGRSEQQRSSLQALTSTLTEGQSALERIYKEKAELLLARVGAESRRMAAEGERWAEERAQLTADLQEQGSTIRQLETTVAGWKRQSTAQHDQLTRANNIASSARTEIEARDRKISALESQLARTAEQLREAVENPGRPLIIEFLDTLSEILGARPGCLVGLAALAVVVAAIIFVVSSIIGWMSPCPSLLGT